MRLFVGIVFFIFLSIASASAQRAAHGPGFARVEWAVSVSKHVLARVNRSKPQLRAALAMARSSGFSTTVVYVAILASRNGRIEETKVIRSSGNPELDSTVERLVLRSSPLPAAPASFAKQQQVFTVPFRFRP